MINPLATSQKYPPGNERVHIPALEVRKIIIFKVAKLDRICSHEGKWCVYLIWYNGLLWSLFNWVVKSPCFAQPTRVFLRATSWLKYLHSLHSLHLWKNAFNEEPVGPKAPSQILKCSTHWWCQVERVGKRDSWNLMIWTESWIIREY